MKKFVIMLMITVLGIITIGCSSTQGSELSTKEKVEDFEYMYKVIKEGYPYLEVNKRLNNVDWLANKEAYLDRVKATTNDEEFISEMTDIVGDLNNGHTMVINSKEIYTFLESVLAKAGWYDFWKDEHVVNRYKSIGDNKESTKQPIVKKDITTKDVIDKKVGYIHLPQMYMESENVTMKDIEADMKLIDDYVRTLENHQALIIDIRGNGGGADSYWSSIVSKITKKDINKKGYLLFRNDSEVMKKYVDKRGFDVEPIENLPKEILEKAPKEVDTDFTEFHEQIIKVPTNYMSKFEGNIYLLVDKVVYSSSESFAIFCKDTGFATIIGERTGGDGGGIDPIMFDLENSGLLVKISSDMYLTDDGTCNEEFKTTPDYEVSDVTRTENFEDDKCIQKVLEIENIK